MTPTAPDGPPALPLLRDLGRAPYGPTVDAMQAFTAERTERASTSLRSLGEEVESGRLGVRDAVVAQHALIELLQADVAARRAWCLASVELARAAGVPLEGATR